MNLCSTNATEGENASIQGYSHCLELVRSIGFGGLLMFPALRQINLRFSVWLMSKVDPLSQTLVIDSEKKLPFNKEDVERVFGIPSSGNSVFALGAPSKKVINKVADMYLPGRAKDKRSVKAAQDTRMHLESHLLCT